MTRTVDNVKFVDTWIYDIAPMTKLILEENKDKSRICKVLWNVDVWFDIGERYYMDTINLTDRVCCFRTLQLRDIPCQICYFYFVPHKTGIWTTCEPLV